MVNLEHHHRRIRRGAKAIHFALIPLALLVPVAWIYMAFGVCQEAESPAVLAACQVFQLTPLLPAGLGVLVLGFIWWELHAVGIKWHREKHGAEPARASLSHAARGYREIDHSHRRHIHFAAAQVLVVGLALIAWLVYEIIKTTY